MEAEIQKEIIANFDAGVTGIMEITRKLYVMPSEVIRVLQEARRVTTVLADLTDEQLGAILAQGCRRAHSHPSGSMVWTCRAYPSKKDSCYVCLAREEIDKRVAAQNSKGGGIEAHT